jgi:hypothetical protein
MASLYSVFAKQKRTSKARGIKFILSYEEWLKIWVASGHLANRGKQKGQYCMARFGDVGPYAAWNVEIITHQENSARGQLGRSPSITTREKQRQSMLGQKLGPHSAEAKRKMSLAHKGKHTGIKNIRAKLTEKEVLDIYRSNEPQHTITKKYNISRSQALRIKTGYSWNSITEHHK